MITIFFFLKFVIALMNLPIKMNTSITLLNN